MSIFDRIKKAIFGQDRDAPAAAPGPRPSPAATPPAPQRPAPQASAAPAPVVDIEQVLEARSKAAGQPLNWRTSIVDLMKLVDLDPSLENRKELARELGYQGSTSDSAAMNIWLHRQVMKKLAESGGKVPASLKD